MFHSGNFARDPLYRSAQFQTCPEDRPLVVQFAANDPETLLAAAKYVENQCDAIDINLGCPQKIAKRGRYGAFLLEEPTLVYSMVEILHKNLSIPVFCKIRLLSTLEKTLEFAKGLEMHGCQLLVVHGRTKEQVRSLQGASDWNVIKRIKEELSIPVIANGSIQEFSDVQQCIDKTVVDGVMSADAVLRNPAFFSGAKPEPIKLMREYLELVKIYPTESKYISAHLYGILSYMLNTPNLRHYRLLIKKADKRNIDGLSKLVDEIELRSFELSKKIP